MSHGKIEETTKAWLHNNRYQQCITRCYKHNYIHIVNYSEFHLLEVFVFPSFCKPGMPTIAHLIIVDGQREWGRGHVKFKEWWPSQSAAIKSTSKQCLDNLRNWIWRNKGATLVLKQTSASGCCCPGVMAITSILHKYADLTTLGLSSQDWLFTGKAQHLHAYWCKR